MSQGLERAKAILAGGGVPPSKRDLALEIEQKVAAGRRVDYYGRKWAAEVLGRPLLRGGRHAVRPDASDRRAGDDSFGGFDGDDDLVVIG